MLLRAAIVATTLALAACGGRAAATAPANHGVAAAAEPEAVLTAFADALVRDDGAAMAGLVDPDHGVTLWYTPGAGVAAFATIAATDTAAPSSHTVPTSDDRPEVWGSYPWTNVAAAITEGLGKLDRDPADRAAPIYGDCGDMEAPVRAYLAHGLDDRWLHESDLGGDGEVDDAAVLTGLAEFNLWGTSVFLRQTAAGWRVVHVVVQDVCSA